MKTILHKCKKESRLLDDKKVFNKFARYYAC